MLISKRTLNRHFNYFKFVFVIKKMMMTKKFYLYDRFFALHLKFNTSYVKNGFLMTFVQNSSFFFKISQVLDFLTTLIYTQ